MYKLYLSIVYMYSLGLSDNLIGPVGENNIVFVFWRSELVCLL